MITNIEGAVEIVTELLTEWLRDSSPDADVFNPLPSEMAEKLVKAINVSESL